MKRCLVLAGYGALVGLTLMTVAVSTSAEPPQPEWAQLRYYPSSETPGLKLAANFLLPKEPKPILVTAHGWHGRLILKAPDARRPKLLQDFFIVDVDMRGRAFSDGKPDANGWELQDWVDAVNYARSEFAAHIRDPDIVYALGDSGAGGNVFGMVGKFPDFLTAAVARYGISDYALWYRNDAKSEFRDELLPWIGGSPDEKPEAYRSRGGLTTAGNRLTPLLVYHGELDPRCPVEQARNYVAAGKKLTTAPLEYHELAGVAATGGHLGGLSKKGRRKMDARVREFLLSHRAPPVLPEKGRLVVAGYVKTDDFEIIWDSVDRVGVVEYETGARGIELAIRPETACRATVFLPSKRRGGISVRRGFVISEQDGPGGVRLELKLTKKTVVTLGNP